MTETATPAVVLLHGAARTPRSLRTMERALQDEGFATLNLAYPSRRYPLQVLIDRVHDPIDAFAARTDTLHFVTHSMADHIVLGASHSGLMTHRDAISQTIAFLRDGRFLQSACGRTHSRTATTNRRGLI